VVLSAPAISRFRAEISRLETRLSAPSLREVVVRGAVGGLIATVLMTLYRLPVFRALPPTSEFWAEYVGGGEPDQYLLEGLLLHAVYGAVGGIGFGPVFAYCLSATEALPALSGERVGVLSGVAYGMALSAFGERVIFDHLLRKELKSGEALIFHAGHFVYGLTLGTWVSSHEETGDVYEE
jgi:hypothetical protein